MSIHYSFISVATNATARGLAGKAVVNMSIAGPKSTALNSAITALTRAGITVVVAAGNEDVRSSTVGSWYKLIFLSKTP